MRGRGNSAASHDFYAYDATDQIWNGTAWVAKVAADYAAYRLPATKISDVNDTLIDEWFTAADISGAVRYEMLERGEYLADSPVVWADDISFDLLQADESLEDVEGVRKLKRYRRGTSTELITAKSAKQIDGTDLTDPTTQRLAGYRE